jgi:hypothetical protein
MLHVTPFGSALLPDLIVGAMVPQPGTGATTRFRAVTSFSAQSATEREQLHAEFFVLNLRFLQTTQAILFVRGT